MATRKGLFLSRFVGERIVIGGNATVEVAAVLIDDTTGRVRVRLCIEAPPEVTVNREEVEQRVAAK